MVIQLANFGSNFSNLPPLQVIFTIENVSVLLLEFPKFRVNIKCTTKVGLPLFVPILW